jgi:hypothetical protein
MGKRTENGAGTNSKRLEVLRPRLRSKHPTSGSPSTLFRHQGESRSSGAGYLNLAIVERIAAQRLVES